MRYLNYETLLGLYRYLMVDIMGEGFYGVRDESVIRSTLARPRQAAEYEKAGGLRQAAYLFHGLLMNHGFVQGNKRIAYLGLEWFLRRNDLGEIVASDERIIKMCLSAVSKRWGVDQIETWLAQHVEREKDRDSSLRSE